MRARHVGLIATAIALAACATALPPAKSVREVQSIVGTYSGTMREVNKIDRPARVVIQSDGKFEITAAAPDGFRTVGVIAVEPDGSLSYSYDDKKGKAMVYEGDGRRVIVFTQAGEVAKTTVDMKLR